MTTLSAGARALVFAAAWALASCGGGGAEGDAATPSGVEPAGVGPARGSTAGTAAGTAAALANTAPVAAFATPASGAVLTEGDRLPVLVTASDDSRVTKVRLYVNGAFVRQENYAPYEWPNAGASDAVLRSVRIGTHELLAQVFDDSGATTEIRTTVTVRARGSEPPAETRTYVKNDGPAKNPLKGWNSGWWDNWPEASVGFQYIKWKEFEPVNGVFNFKAVEDVISRPGSAGRHLILRLYCEWDGKEDTQCPAWMYSERGVARLRDDKGRWITDFNNPAYLAEAVQALEALGARYNADPRLYAFQLGVLGYWGEWHTFPSDFKGQRFPLAEAGRLEIIAANKRAFPGVHLMGRQPWEEPLKSTGGIGFHNDFFVPNHGHSDEFDRAIAAGSLWRNGPVGGEAPVRDSDELPGEVNALFNSPKGLQMIEAGRYSTMKPGQYRRVLGQSGYAQYLRLHKRMGYNFQLDEARFASAVPTTDALPVRLRGSNIGVAPMYREWVVQFGLLDADGRAVREAPVRARLPEILPGQAFQFDGTVQLANLPAGAYKLAVRIVQPDAYLPKAKPWGLDARNTYILFANEMPVVDGRWNTQNALEGGWSVLGAVTLR